MTEPLISIIIPVYNAEKYLRACLDSVLAQTYKNWEAICVNDGSSDNSAQILKEYAAKDTRFHIINQPNGGGSSSRNRALQAINGQYVAFLDNDDLYHPQYLEILYANLQKSQSDISCCSYLKFYGDDDYVFKEKHHANFDAVYTLPFRAKFLRKKKIESLMWCKLYKSELLKNINFSLKLPAINDMLFNIAVLLASKKAVCCKYQLVAYRQSDNNQTLKPLSDKRIEEYTALPAEIINLVKTYPQEQKILRKIASRYAFGMFINDFCQKYNLQKDTELYEKLRSDLQKLINQKIVRYSDVSLKRKIAIYAFLHKHFTLLKFTL